MNLSVLDIAPGLASSDPLPIALEPQAQPNRRKARLKAQLPENILSIIDETYLDVVPSNDKHVHMILSSSSMHRLVSARNS